MLFLKWVARIPAQRPTALYGISIFDLPQLVMMVLMLLFCHKLLLPAACATAFAARATAFTATATATALFVVRGRRCEVSGMQHMCDRNRQQADFVANSGRMCHIQRKLE